MAKTTEKQSTQPKSVPPTVTYEVQQVFAKYRDDSGETQTMSKGWVIVQATETGRPMFCGPGFCWCPSPYAIIPFSDEETAKTQMKFHAASQAERDRPREIKSCVVEIPYCELKALGNNATRLTARFSPEVSHFISEVQTALQQVKAETSDGLRVDSPTATVRWILEQIAAGSR